MKTSKLNFSVTITNGRFGEKLSHNLVITLQKLTSGKLDSNQYLRRNLMNTYIAIHIVLIINSTEFHFASITLLIHVHFAFILILLSHKTITRFQLLYREKTLVKNHHPFVFICRTQNFFPVLWHIGNRHTDPNHSRTMTKLSKLHIPGRKTWKLSGSRMCCLLAINRIDRINSNVAKALQGLVKNDMTFLIILDFTNITSVILIFH